MRNNVPPGYKFHASGVIPVQRERGFRDCEHRFRNGPESVHVQPESVFTLNRNRCSRSTGIGVHVEPESAFTLDRNPQPRAKAEKRYHANQQLFRTTVRSVVNRLPGFVDGTSYLLRHTNTKTTHLRKPIPNYKNDGLEPYPGITEATCIISPNVKNKDILLIDDIYTPGVNIDEDAIEAILNAGAHTVTFYSVGKA